MRVGAEEAALQQPEKLPHVGILKMAAVCGVVAGNFQKQEHAEKRVGDILVAKGFVTRNQLETGFSEMDGKRIGVQLLEKGVISERQLLAALAEKFCLPFVDLSNLTPSSAVLQKIPRKVVEQFRAFPVALNGRKLLVATSDPSDTSIAETLGFITNHQIDVAVATSTAITRAITTYYRTYATDATTVAEEALREEPAPVQAEVDAPRVPFIELESTVVEWVNKILINAYHSRASDIHFEPALADGPLYIRYRVDGACAPKYQIPAIHKSAVIGRLKIMSKLDIAERRKPQSGKIVLLHEKRRLEFRVEITPTVEGQEDAVLRVVGGAKPLSLNRIGFSMKNLRKFDEILNHPHGIVLCVGPTGSGKTTMLHSALAAINSPDRKIWTAEDPVEIIQEGLRQVQVNPRIGFGFEEALRSFLRADPDVIMIGEMRDAETSKTAIAASLTGHLVFSTLHTNSAPETVGRLMDMGIDRYQFADALLGILAQRLARRLCDNCKTPYHPSPDEYQQLVLHYGQQSFLEHGLPRYDGDLCLMRSRGCPTCDGTGYRGRVALHELMAGAPAVKAAIKENATVEELRRIALQEGMNTLKMDGIQKVLLGVTDLQQVLKVCFV